MMRDAVKSARAPRAPASTRVQTSLKKPLASRCCGWSSRRQAVQQVSGAVFKVWSSALSPLGSPLPA
eukprot:scaffold370_cov166-Pinguiococcus_pyrenoidosus.AAC.2